MVFIPVFISLAEQAEEPASMYLMPLSFVSILGGPSRSSERPRTSWYMEKR